MNKAIYIDTYEYIKLGENHKVFGSFLGNQTLRWKLERPLKYYKVDLDMYHQEFSTNYQYCILQSIVYYTCYYQVMETRRKLCYPSLILIYQFQDFNPYQKVERTFSDCQSIKSDNNRNTENISQTITLQCAIHT